MDKKIKHPDQARELRRMRGNIPVEEFADRLRIKLRTYYRYEAGERKMPAGLMLLAQKMDMPVGQLAEKAPEYELHGGWKPRSIEEIAGVPQGMGMGKAVELLARIYQSKDQSLIRAIYTNLEAFASSVELREKLEEVHADIEELRTDNADLRATMQGFIKAAAGGEQEQGCCAGRRGEPDNSYVGADRRLSDDRRAACRATKTSET